MSRRGSIASPRSRRGGSILVLRCLLRVAFFIEMGLLLVVLPWSGFWERNYFAQIWPTVDALVANPFIRGAVSGLGFVNLFAGAAELVPVFAERARHDVVIGDGADTPQVGR